MIGECGHIFPKHNQRQPKSSMISKNRNHSAFALPNPASASAPPPNRMGTSTPKWSLNAEEAAHGRKSSKSGRIESDNGWKFSSGTKSCRGYHTLTDEQK